MFEAGVFGLLVAVGAPVLVKMSLAVVVAAAAVMVMVLMRVCERDSCEVSDG